MSKIKELDEQKMLIHREAYIKKYPFGTFSIQIRDIPVYLEGSNKASEWRKKISLRWGTKITEDSIHFSTHYYTKSFTISEDNVFHHGINNSFGTVKYYSTLEALLKKARELGLRYNPIHDYVQLYSRYSGVRVSRPEGSRDFRAHYPENKLK